MRLMFIVVVSLVLTIVQAVPGQAKRIALIIGNSDYVNLKLDQQLKSPVNDAREVAKRLREIGYTIFRAGRTVDVGINVTRRQFNNVWARFKRMIGPGDTALIYFTGHGLESGGQNFFVPSDIDEIPDGDPEEKTIFLVNNAISVTGLLSEFQRLRKKLTKKGQVEPYGIFILDACREVPLSSSGKKSFGGVQAGMAPVSHPSGTFIMYSAELGQTALDRLSDNDPGPYSIYTRKLLDFLTDERAIINLPDLAQILRLQVYNEALNKRNKKDVVVGHTQTPAYYDGLLTRRSIRGDRPGAGAAALVARLWQGLTPGGQPSSQVASLAGTKSILGARNASLRARKLQELRRGNSSRSDNRVNPTQQDCRECPELIVVAGEPFTMGSREGEIGSPYEKERRIDLNHNFAIGKFEVTFQEWRECQKTGDCPRVHTDYDTSDKLRDDRKKPMVNLSWDDAQAYVGWLNKITKLEKSPYRYRLPSEAEWEFSARAGSAKRYSFGDDKKELCSYANGADEKFKLWLWKSNSCNDEWGAEPAPVGHFKPNALGIYDMHGNVWEWVADCWSDRLADLPDDGTALNPNKGKSCNRRSARGGSWHSPPEALRSASRNSFSPSHSRRTLGFRVARTLPALEGREN